MSGGALRIENVLIQIRAKLNEDKIKLWCLPYYDETLGANVTEMESLAGIYTVITNIPKDQCVAALHELQNNAIDKLSARKEFSVTGFISKSIANGCVYSTAKFNLLKGVATLKLRVPEQQGGTKLLTIKQKLDVNGNQLQANISGELGIAANRIKMLSGGKVIKENELLNAQDVNFNQQILVLILPESPTDGAVAEDQIYEKLRKTREDAELLVDGQNNFLHMEDQSGNAVHLPPIVKKQLMIALALHEKGRTEMNKENFKEALIYFTEADQEYEKCDQKWLDAVDNYAILNLDIVWSYLCLKSIMQLPDAERRLTLCEQNFRKSYGDNFDRVLALKGTSGNEKALIMRLQLLQAIVFFHQNRRFEAANKLRKAETELNYLKINTDSLNMLVEMGYTLSESRLGLRACNGDISEAITHILNTREKRSEARKKAKEETILEKLLAKTNPGTNGSQWVNPRDLQVLIDMGFSRVMSAVAMKKADSDLGKAIDLLQNNQSELLKEISITPSHIQQLLKMGYDQTLSEVALRNSLDNLDDAIEYLVKIQTDGTYNAVVESLLNNPEIKKLASAFMNTKNTAGASGSGLIDKTKQIEQENQAFERFSEGFETTDDDYLDLPLVKEESLLNEYKKYLN